MESSSRPISPRAFERILNSRGHERALPLHPIQMWVLKEACYKANPCSQGSVISDYEVVSFQSAPRASRAASASAAVVGTGIGIWRGSDSSFSFQLQLLEIENWTLGFAVSTPGTGAWAPAKFVK